MENAMKFESKLFVYMNKKFEFIDDNGDVTKDIYEAVGYGSLEEAKKHLADFDEPTDWRIVTKYTNVEIGEIVYEPDNTTGGGKAVS